MAHKQAHIGQRGVAPTIDAAMAAMAADPAIRRECASITAEFAPADLDGLTPETSE